MASCIFCSKKTSHTIAAGKSICLDCLIKLKKFEYSNRETITDKVLPLSLKQTIKDAANITKQARTTDLSGPEKEFIKKAKKAVKTLKL